MKELITNQPSKCIVLMMKKMMDRSNCELYTNNLYPSINIFYEILQRGTYTACILTVGDKIIGLGMTKRDRNDKYNPRVAIDVSVHKAIKDYLFGIKPEYLHAK